MADSAATRIDQQIGNYRLVRLLGRGGFAEVYLGQHLYLNTQAAIKILHALQDQGEQANFLNEARIIAHLTHPNIIRVLDFGTQNSEPYLVMDYAPNGSLRDRHPRGSRLPLDTVLPYVSQVAAALQYAHDRRLIHRDVKPENMLVGQENQILMSDFGISVIAQETQSQPTQNVIGSAPYIAPEQLQGHPRPASDQYALGVVVYEWLTGDRPFHGASTEVYGQHLFSPPPPLRSKNPAIAPAVEEVVLKALSKDPHQRYASIQGFAAALEQAASPDLATAAAALHPAPALEPTTPAAATAVTSEPVEAGAPTVAATPPASTIKQSASVGADASGPRIGRRAVLATGLGVAGLAVLGGGFVWYSRSHTPTPQPTPTPGPKSYPPQGTLIYTYKKHNALVLAVAWHNQRIASASADHSVQIWDATTGDHVLPYHEHLDNVNALAWSPDGHLMASASADNTVHVWDTTTGAQRFVYRGHGIALVNKGVTSVAWSPDAKYLASGGIDGTVQVWDASNGTPIYTFKGHFDAFGFPHHVNAVTWSPSSTQIASAANDNQVKVWDATTGNNAFSYTKHTDHVLTVAWSPDGRRIASGSLDAQAHVWDARVGNQLGAYTKHTDEVRSLTWQPTGALIASASKDLSVQLWDPSTLAQAFVFSQSTAPVNSVAWAGDAHRLASGGEDQFVMVWEGI